MDNIAKYIDHTLLKPEATIEEIKQLCLEAREYKFASVCVNPVYVRLCVEELAGSGVKICTVCSFPLGANTPDQKAAQALRSVEDGADEIDMVAHIGSIIAEDWENLKNEVHSVRNATKDKTLKVIIETSLLTDEQIKKVTEVIAETKADFVKTSTGFFGSAELKHVEIMAKAANKKINIKASGGIRDYSQALEFINLGATRIGTSSSLAIVNNKNSQNEEKENNDQ